MENFKWKIMDDYWWMFSVGIRKYGLGIPKIGGIRPGILAANRRVLVTNKPMIFSDQLMGDLHIVIVLAYIYDIHLGHGYLQCHL